MAGGDMDKPEGKNYRGGGGSNESVFILQEMGWMPLRAKEIAGIALAYPIPILYTRTC